MRKSKALIALADKIEPKYEDEERSFSTDHDRSLFTLINKDSHLAEKISRESLKLHNKLTDYEMYAESFPKSKLFDIEYQLVSILETIQKLNR